MFTLENNVSSNAILGYSFFNNNKKILALLIANRIFLQRNFGTTITQITKFLYVGFLYFKYNSHICFSIQPKISSP